MHRALREQCSKNPGDNLYTLTRSALRAFVFDRCLFCKRKGLDSLIRLADGASLSCVVVLVEAYSSRRSAFSANPLPIRAIS